MSYAVFSFIVLAGLSNPVSSFSLAKQSTYQTSINQPIQLARHHPYESRRYHQQRRPGSLYNYGKPLYPGFNNQNLRFRGPFHGRNRGYYNNYYQGYYGNNYRGRGNPGFYSRQIIRNQGKRGNRNCYQSCSFGESRSGERGYTCVKRCN